MVALSHETTHQTIPAAIRAEICQRAARLSEEAHVSSTILGTMREAKIDFSQVTLEEMKVVLVQALRAFRGNSQRRRGARGSAA